jgi:hypothetical protein
MPLTSHILKAQVISHDPEKDSVYLQLASGQLLGYPVQRLYSVADGMRISKKPLPVRGSWVMVGFSGGDMRSAIVLGAYHPNLVDAIPNAAGDPFSDYDSHYSGHWSHLDGVSGHLAMQFADTSSFVVSSGGTLPVIFRHMVDDQQEQKRVPFTQQDRNPKPQNPFGWWYQQAASGSMGGTTAAIDVSGNFSMAGSGMGKTMTMTFSNTTVQVDAQGNTKIALGGSATLDVSQGGGALTDFVGLVSKLVSNFNSHTHGGVMAGGDISGTPTSPWTANTIKSLAIKISD